MGHTKLKLGDIVSLSAPFGIFTPEAMGFEAVAFVTAGIGITPALAMAQAESTAGRIKGAFHVDRSSKYDGMSVRLAELAGCEVKKYYRQTHKAVQKALAGFASKMGPDTHFVICGPMGFMQEAYEQLSANGAKHIHHEVFGT